jgi:hypothetical protein
VENQNHKKALVIVSNFRFLKKYFNKTFSDIRKIGNYTGEIIVITNPLCPTFLITSLRKKNNIKVIRFRKIRFTNSANNILKNLNTGSELNRHLKKQFQWHKIHLFDEKLKAWKFIFYLDINMNIHSDINHILEIPVKNNLLARADAFPDYNRTLSTQFDTTNTIYKSLEVKYDLERKNYFQTGIMYFDTSIIGPKTKNEIIALVEEYPISITNEQGILNLYFYLEKNLYRELPDEVNGYTTYFYWKIKNRKVIISKADKFYAPKKI